MMINSVLNSDDVSTLASNLCSSLESDDALEIIDPTEASATNPQISQSTEKRINKRKKERTENSNEKNSADNVKRFKYNLRDRSGSRQAALKRHHHSAHKMKCEICLQQFETQLELDEHIKKHMPEN